MKKLLTLILVIVALIGLIKTADSIISCYKCNSALDPNCDQLEENSTYLVNCTDEADESDTSEYKQMDLETYLNSSSQPELEMMQLNASSPRNYTICRKIETMIYEKRKVKGVDSERVIGMWKPRIVRQCGHIKSEEGHDTKCIVLRSPSIYQITCSCITDACNYGHNNLKFELRTWIMTIGLLPTLTLLLMF